MADRGKEPGNRGAGEPGDPVVVERVHELSWALLDEQVTDDEIRLLDNLLLSDDKARETYIGCVQLHTDLMAHFASPATQATARSTAKSPVLGFLNEGVPTFGFQSPSEDAKS